MISKSGSTDEVAVPDTEITFSLEGNGVTWAFAWFSAGIRLTANPVTSIILVNAAIPIHLYMTLILVLAIYDVLRNGSEKKLKFFIR